MTSSPLQAALRAGADGLYALEASVSLLISAVLHAAGRRQFRSRCSPWSRILVIAVTVSSRPSCTGEVRSRAASVL